MEAISAFVPPEGLLLGPAKRGTASGAKPEGQAAAGGGAANAAAALLAGGQGRTGPTVRIAVEEEEERDEEGDGGSAAASRDTSPGGCRARLLTSNARFLLCTGQDAP